MVSVIVPIYNTRRELLYNCVNSIRSQTVPCELILVDDGSTRQETLDYLAEIEHEGLSNVILIRQENHGGANARFTGIKAANNDLVVFVDNDDELEPDACEFMEQTLKAKEVEFVQFAAKTSKQYSWNNTEQDRYINGTQAILEDLLLPEERSKEGLHIGWEMWACIFKKDILLRTYDIEDHIFLGPDLVTKTEYLLACSKAYISNKFVYFYNIGNTESSTKGKKSIRTLTTADFNVKIYNVLKDTTYEKLIEISGIRSCNTLIGAIGDALRVGAGEKVWSYRRMMLDDFWQYRKSVSGINQVKMLVIKYFPWVYLLPH